MNPRLCSILANVLGIRQSEVNMALTKRDVGSWDSLKQMDLVLSLENEYDIQIDVMDIQMMTSVSGIVSVLKQYGVSLED